MPRTNLKLFIFGSYAASRVGGATPLITARLTANVIAMRVAPLIIRLTPTRIPMAHTELDGHWA